MENKLGRLCFTINTYLTPALQREGINFRYEDDSYNSKIFVVHKNIYICRVEALPDLDIDACYRVDWYSTSSTSPRCKKYTNSRAVIRDIKDAITYSENRGENKMNNKMYKVSDVRARSSSANLDELIVTVRPLESRGIGLADCDRIKEAIESIDDTKNMNKSCYMVCGRGNGKTKFLRDVLLNNALGYCDADAFSTYKLFQMFNKTSIKDVIFNNPATIVLWTDGTKTVVKAENEEFDPEKGLAMAMAKKALGNNHEYYDIFKKYVGRYEKKQKKGGK